MTPEEIDTLKDILMRRIQMVDSWGDEDRETLNSISRATIALVELSALSKFVVNECEQDDD